MKHVATITKTTDCPAKADSLLAKAQWLDNADAAVSVVQHIVNLVTKA